MAEYIVNDEQIALPTSTENLEDTASNLNPGNEDPPVSKSRTSSLGKMFQKMRLSEVRSKLKREGGGSKEHIAKTTSALCTSETKHQPELTTSESIEAHLSSQETKSKSLEKDSDSTRMSNKGLRNYLGSWNACWQKPPNSDDISENEYQTCEVVKNESICANCDIAADDDALKDVPLRPMSPTTVQDEEQK